LYTKAKGRLLVLGVSLKEIVTGRKTFFIAPDRSRFPENFLEEYFAMGYECYFIENDKHLTLEKKIEVIVSVFKDCILFFNIDANLPDVFWPKFIAQLQEQYNDRILIGIMYTKRQSKEEKAKIERKYLLEIGITCGAVQLEYQKGTNFIIIQNLLFANQAQGRRKTIRAVCNKSCNFTFNLETEQHSSTLQDISLSHFSFVYPNGKLNIQLYEKIQEIHFNICGFLFRSDAILIMERPVNGEMLYVFSFVSQTGNNGLDERLRQLLTPSVYQLMATNTSALLRQLFINAERQQMMANNGFNGLGGIDDI